MRCSFLPLNCLCNYIVCFALKYMSLSHILPLSLETFDLVIASSSFVLISHLYSACLEFLRTVLFCLPSLPFQASRAFLSIALWQKRIGVTGDFLHRPYLLIIFILQQPYRYQTCKKWWCSFRKHRQQNVTRCDKIDCWAIQHWTHQVHKSADLIKTSPNVKRHLYHLQIQSFVSMISWRIHGKRQPSMHDIIIESTERRGKNVSWNWRTQFCFSEKAGRVYLIYRWLIAAGVLAQFWRLKIATCLISLIWGWPIASSLIRHIGGMRARERWRVDAVTNQIVTINFPSPL